MNTKGLAIAVVVLGLLAGLAWWQASRETSPAPGTADNRVGQPLVTPEALQDVDWIEIAHEDDEEPLVFIVDGGHWILAEYYALPVDFDRLSDFTDMLLDGEIRRRVTDDPDRMERLGLGRFHITLNVRGGDTVREIVIGEDGPQGGQFVRFGDGGPAYLTTNRIGFDTVPANWAEKQPLRIEPDEVSMISFQFRDRDELFRLVRGEKGGAFEPDGESLPGDGRISQRKVNEFLDLLVGATYRDILPPDEPDAEGARENAHTVRIATFEGERYLMEIGRRPGDAVAGNADGTEAGEPEAVSSVVFDQDGNIVPEEEPAEDGFAGQGDLEEGDPGRGPGPVFVFYESSDPDFVWTHLMETIALEFPDSVYEAFPASPEALME